MKTTTSLRAGMEVTNTTNEDVKYKVSGGTQGSG
jgi:hypothetical protein